MIQTASCILTMYLNIVPHCTSLYLIVPHCTSTYPKIYLNVPQNLFHRLITLFQNA
jgi:hypothetical protein